MVRTVSLEIPKTDGESRAKSLPWELVKHCSEMLENPKDGEVKQAWLILHQAKIQAILGLNGQSKNPDSGVKPRLSTKPALTLERSNKKVTKVEPPRLTQNTLRVLFQLIGRMAFGNWVAFPQSILAKELGISRQAYSRALTDLQRGALILRPYVSSPYGVRPIIMVSPELAERGTNDYKSFTKAVWSKMLKKMALLGRIGKQGQQRPRIEKPITGKVRRIRKKN